MRGRTLRPEERRVWAKVAATVTPRPGRIVPSTDDIGSAPRKTEPDDAKPRSHPPGLERFAAQAASTAPAARSNERRVRRGQVDIAGRLDLHGFTQDQARVALAGFVKRLRATGGRCGLVITGKGRLGREGVLRRRFPEWLAEPELAALVSGYAPAHARHGGEGAWYLFVRRGE
jgi:DNA-nicking Smr family endonuclease